jgi:hypothetical protein
MRCRFGSLALPSRPAFRRLIRDELAPFFLDGVLIPAGRLINGATSARYDANTTNPSSSISSSKPTR